MDDRTFAPLSRRALVASALDTSGPMTRTPPARFHGAPTHVPLLQALRVITLSARI
jgi:hypothetical protein